MHAEWLSLAEVILAQKAATLSVQKIDMTMYILAFGSKFTYHIASIKPLSLLAPLPIRPRLLETSEINHPLN